MITQKRYKTKLAGLTVVALLSFGAISAFAHCDTLDGPVVAAARQALASNNVNLVLIWVQKADEPEIRKAFEKTIAVRKLNAEARDLADMRAFAARDLGIDDPQAWDWPYIGEKLKEARYAFSEQEVKPYFTAPKVLAGLFKIVETLFEVSIHRDHAPVWHPSVEFYRIERGGMLVGQFYLDPSARAGKRGGARGQTETAEEVHRVAGLGRLDGIVASGRQCFSCDSSTSIVPRENPRR